jgi:hypothetical protein
MIRTLFAVLALTFAAPAFAQAEWIPSAASATQIHNLDTSGYVKVGTLGANPCAASNSTLAMVSGSTTGTTAVEIIALSGTTKIYVCGLSIVGVSGTTPTFSLVYGTGTNCGTGQAVMLGAWTTAANTVYHFAASPAVVPAGQALCYLQTGTSPVSRYMITYVRQ